MIRVALVHGSLRARGLGSAPVLDTPVLGRSQVRERDYAAPAAARMSTAEFADGGFADGAFIAATFNLTANRNRRIVRQFLSG